MSHAPPSPYLVSAVPASRHACRLLTPTLHDRPPPGLASPRNCHGPCHQRGGQRPDEAGTWWHELIEAVRGIRCTAQGGTDKGGAEERQKRCARPLGDSGTPCTPGPAAGATQGSRTVRSVGAAERVSTATRGAGTMLASVEGSHPCCTTRWRATPRACVSGRAPSVTMPIVTDSRSCLPLPPCSDTPRTTYAADDVA